MLQIECAWCGQLFLSKWPGKATSPRQIFHLTLSEQLPRKHHINRSTGTAGWVRGSPGWREGPHAGFVFVLICSLSLSFKKLLWHLLYEHCLASQVPVGKYTKPSAGIPEGLRAISAWKCLGKASGNEERWGYKNWRIWLQLLQQLTKGTCWLRAFGYFPKCCTYLYFQPNTNSMGHGGTVSEKLEWPSRSPLPRSARKKCQWCTVMLLSLDGIQPWRLS